MGEDSFIGSIGKFAGDRAPHGWVECAGQELTIQTHAALYSIIGTIYGGDDGSTFFKIPDLRPISGDRRIDWSAVHQPRECICIEGVYPHRE